MSPAKSGAEVDFTIVSPVSARSVTSTDGGFLQPTPHLNHNREVEWWGGRGVGERWAFNTAPEHFVDVHAVSRRLAASPRLPNLRGAGGAGGEG